jgi:hypothetical protein
MAKQDKLTAYRPLIAAYADETTSVPVYISGALFIVAGVLVALLPFETRGKASL